MARMVDLAVTTYWWVETIANPLAPTATEITAGENISQYLTTATTFGADDSDTVSEKAITETAQIDVPTIQKYAASLEFFRDFTANAPSATDLSNIFQGGNEQGYLVRRIGYPSSTAVASTQSVEIGKFIADVPKYRGGEGNGFVKGSVKMLQQGFYKANVDVAGP